MVKKGHTMNNNTGYKTFKIFNILFISLMFVVIIFPYLNVLARAFNEGSDTSLGGITIYPRVPTLRNFSLLINNDSVIGAAIISISRVVLGTLFALAVQFSAAYTLTKKRLLGRNFILILLTIPMFFSGGLIPQYILYSRMHLLNSFLIYILPFGFSFFNMIVIRTFLYTIPASLEESAKLDGANEVTIFIKVIIPLSLPIVATISLWMAVFHWNDWVTTLYFVTNSRMHTLQFILMQMIQESDRLARLIQEDLKKGAVVNQSQYITPDAVRSAQVIITTLPIILVYPFLQKYFIKGVMIGSIKE